jgi:hypothetical protein
LPEGNGFQVCEVFDRIPLKTMKPDELAAFKRLPLGTTVKIRYRRGAAEPAEVNVVLIKQ